MFNSMMGYQSGYQMPSFGMSQSMMMPGYQSQPMGYWPQMSQQNIFNNVCCPQPQPNTYNICYQQPQQQPSVTYVIYQQPPVQTSSIYNNLVSGYGSGLTSNLYNSYTDLSSLYGLSGLSSLGNTSTNSSLLSSLFGTGSSSTNSSLLSSLLGTGSSSSTSSLLSGLSGLGTNSSELNGVYSVLQGAISSISQLASSSLLMDANTKKTTKNQANAIITNIINSVKSILTGWVTKAFA